jgi:tetratricopeptide (TPR) repeat protein
LLARATVRNFLSQWSECLELTATILADPAADKRVRAQAHLLAEWSGSRLGCADVQEHSERAEEILLELDDSIGLANLYLNRGERAWRECRVADSITSIRAASERYERAGDVVGAALAENNLSEILTVQFRLDAAESLLIRARRVLESADYPHGTFATLSGLSRIAAWRGHVETATELQRDALAGFRSLGAAEFVTDSLIRTVEIQILAGDSTAAIATADDAAVSLAGLGAVLVLPATLSRLRGQALMLAGRRAEARAQFDAAKTIAERDASSYELALAEIGLGRVDGDEQLINSGLARLTTLDVLAPPPGL